MNYPFDDLRVAIRCFTVLTEFGDVFLSAIDNANSKMLGFDFQPSTNGSGAFA